MGCVCVVAGGHKSSSVGVVLCAALFAEAASAGGG
jgi:hypothetical protein